MNRHQIETFEKDIYNIITKCLSEDETIEFDLHFDFRVPNGVKKLNWEKNTVIEIKYRFIYNSFERIRYSFDLYSPTKLIIVVIEENSLSLRLNCNATMTGRAIEVLSYNDLIQKAKTEVFGQNDSKQTESLG